VTFLLDTNVLSEGMKPVPSAAVTAWLDAEDEDRLFVSVITLAEIRRGIALKEAGRRRAALETWLRDELSERFAGRIIDIDRPIAEAWADLMASSRRRGIGLSVMDGFLAATAQVRGLRVVTRNVRDFAALAVPLVNPWNAA
jgi:toxin FitB